jgi:hypothetical protein
MQIKKIKSGIGIGAAQRLVLQSALQSEFELETLVCRWHLDLLLALLLVQFSIL